jgi:Vitamin B12 dependent methionine synthase, activation domain
MPRSRIYRRLGFRKDTTRLTDNQRNEIEAYIDDASSLIRLQGTGRRLRIHDIHGSSIFLPDGLVLKSGNLADFLRGCTELVLMGGTAGNEIMNAIQRDTAGNHMTRGVVLDAAASETVDHALDWMMNYFSRHLIRENKTLMKKRFSAGYGDLLLENQRIIYRLLEMERIGVELTESCILVPEKSVTAVTGIAAQQA